MVWWSRKKSTSIEETLDLDDKINSIQSQSDISTLISVLYDILTTMNKRLIDLEKAVNIALNKYKKRLVKGSAGSESEL